MCAATNRGRLQSFNIDYPAAFGSVICVGSHTINGMPSPFTSIGREVDFLAPGQDIISVAPNCSFASCSGTSFAAPFVAGLVALVLSFDQHRNNSVTNIAQIREILRSVCSKSGHHDQESGYGVLNPRFLFEDMNTFYRVANCMKSR